MLALHSVRNAPMKKLVVALVLLVVLALAAVAAGPFVAVRGIRNAVEAQDTAALARHVDFPTLRANLKAQVEDQIARRAGPDAQANLFGALALRLAGSVTGGIVDAMVTPAGIGALIEGRGLWHRASGGGVTAEDAYAHRSPDDVLKDARYGFESTSRFTATVPSADGPPLVFVLTRDGLTWRLTDIRLPLGAADAALPAG